MYILASDFVRLETRVVWKGYFVFRYKLVVFLKHFCSFKPVIKTVFFKQYPFEFVWSGREFLMDIMSPKNRY